jgi:hypothetical protein
VPGATREQYEQVEIRRCDLNRRFVMGLHDRQREAFNDIQISSKRGRHDDAALEIENEPPVQIATPNLNLLVLLPRGARHMRGNARFNPNPIVQNIFRRFLHSGRERLATDDLQSGRRAAAWCCRDRGQ